MKQQLTYFQLFYVGEVLYSVVLVISKVAIVLFYLRIFVNETFRKLAIAEIIFLGITLLTGLCVITFQCKPISGQWNRTIPSKCTNGNAAAYAFAGSGLLHDIIILVLPVVQLSKLQMSFEKKVRVIGMFSLGIL
jgi:hypothetical protein